MSETYIEYLSRMSHSRSCVRKIKGIEFMIVEIDTVNSNGVKSYKAVRVNAAPLNDLENSKDFVVSRAQYCDEFGSVRSGILKKFHKTFATA